MILKQLNLRKSSIHRPTYTTKNCVYLERDKIYQHAEQLGLSFRKRVSAYI